MNRMTETIVLCFLWLVLAMTSQTVAAPAPEKKPFPDADPASVGIPAEALERLSKQVASFVENEEIVGGELLVVKDRRTVLRKAYGWKDRDAEQPLQVDAIYCVRSMTKPLVGTAIQMLIDEGRLAPDTPVHEILPSFDGPETRKITVEQLLTHTGGFPFTTLTRALTEYAGIEEVAAEAAARGVDFEPGSRFEYSDAGSDTLGAIVARVTGVPVDDFIQQRILDPLGMRDTVTLLEGRDEALARIPSAYSGGTAAWSRHWSPSDNPIFPFFLTSQSLYSTTTDYARFLALWMDGGRSGERRLLSAEAVERGLALSREIEDHPRGFGDSAVYYGQQWLVYADEVEETPRRVLFGHNGSDGTHAWAWPELDLMVLFFTQSRGTLAGMGLEPLLQTLLVEQKLDDPSLTQREPTARELEQVAGLYWDETNSTAYYVMSPLGKRLSMERPGRAQLIFKATATPGRYVHEIRPDIWIEFVRSEDGAVAAMRTSFGGNVELDPRHEPRDDLPALADVIASVMRSYRVDRLVESGAVRLSGTIEIEVRKMSGAVEALFDADRSRIEIRFGGSEQLIVTDGDRAWSHDGTTGTNELEGVLREQALLDHYTARFGDWTEHYESVEVLKRIEHNERSILLVRVVPREAPGATMFIDEPTGRVFRSEALAMLPGMGLVGVRNDYDDFREIDGMHLPFKTVTTYATPLIGRVVTQMQTAETGVEVSADAFTEPVAVKEQARSVD